jgi:type VI protein secretion system component VasK
MPILRQLGGFEEELDNGWSWDNVNVAERAAMLGCSFIIDESNRPTLLPHELTSKLELELNQERHHRIMQEIKDGIRPIKNKYL